MGHEQFFEQQGLSPEVAVKVTTKTGNPKQPTAEKYITLGELCQSYAKAMQEEPEGNE